MKSIRFRFLFSLFTVTRRIVFFACMANLASLDDVPHRYLPGENSYGMSSSISTPDANACPRVFSSFPSLDIRTNG